MRKWLKNWWFSILCFVVALDLSIFILIGHIIFTNNDDFIYSLLMINCLSPILLLIIIGVANTPKKGI